MDLIPKEAQAERERLARIARRTAQLQGERERLYEIFGKDQATIAYAAALETAKIGICQKKFNEREIALSHRSAISYYVRSLFYSDILTIINSSTEREAFFAATPEGLETMARRQLSLEAEWAASVEREHPITLSWVDHPLVSRSEFRLVRGVGWEGRELRMSAQITEAGATKNYDEIRYTVLMVTTVYSEREPWIESPVDFYSKEDAKAWAEWFINTQHPGAPSKEGHDATDNS